MSQDDDRYGKLPTELPAAFFSPEYQAHRQQMYANADQLFSMFPKIERTALVDRLLVKVLEARDNDILILKMRASDIQHQTHLTALFNRAVQVLNRRNVLALVVAHDCDVSLFSAESVGELLKRRVQQLSEENRKLREQLEAVKGPASPPPSPPRAG